MMKMEVIDARMVTQTNAQSLVAILYLEGSENTSERKLRGERERERPRATL
jgi:hypothetical protein